MDTDDPVLIEANRWFKKLHNPSNATFKIAHARMSGEAKAMFEILEQYRKTGKERMERLAAAVKEIGKN